MIARTVTLIMSGEEERPYYFCKLKNEEVESDSICNWFKQFKTEKDEVYK